MMTVEFSTAFLKSAKELPKESQEKLARLISLLAANPYDARLHTKRLAGPLAGLSSFRISRDWRVLFQFFDPRTIQLVRVVHRKDIYRSR